MAETVADLSIVIRARNAAKAVLANVRKDFASLISQAKKYRTELESVSKNLLLVGVAATALFVGSAVVFNNLEQEMASVQKTTGLTRVKISGLKNDFVDLSKRIPVSARELASIGAIAGQLGVKGVADILSFTETIAKVSTVTDFAAEEAAESLARLSNILKLPIRDVGRLAGVINELENTTTAKAPVIAEFMQRIAVSGGQINLSASAIAGLSATLVDLGFKAELAGTAVSATFTQMITDADKFGAQMGLTAQEFRLSLENDAIGTIIKWAESIKQLPTEELIAQFDDVGISGTRALQVFGALTEGSGKLQKNVKTANDEFKRGTSLLNEFKVFVETTWKQTEILRNKISALAEFVGQTLNPVWKAAVSVLGFFVDLIDALPDFIKRNLVAFGLFITALTLIAGGLGLLVLAIPLATAALSAMAVVVAPIAPLLIGLAAALGLAIFGFVNFGSQSDEVKEKLKNQKEKLDEVTDAAKKLSDQNIALTGDQKALGNQLNNTSQKLSQVKKAFKNLGLDSEKSIRAEIEKINGSLETLRSSGVASFDDLARAEARATNQTNRLIESLEAEKVEKITTSFEKLTSALGEMDKAQLRVLEKQKDILSADLSAAEQRVSGIRKVIDVENELAAFNEKINDRGLSQNLKNFKLIENLQKKLGSTEKFNGEERIRILKEVGKEAEAAVDKLKDRSSLESAAIKIARESFVKLSEEFKKQENLDPSKSTQKQFLEALNNVETVRGKFNELKEEIANIQANVSITDQDKLIDDAKKLRSQIADKFSTAIIQDVIIRQRFDNITTSIGSNSDRPGTSSSNPRGLNLDPQFDAGGLPSFAKGIRVVPRDMLAQLHKDERVLTARENRELERGGLGGRTITFGDINIQVANSTEAPEITARRIHAELKRIDERRSN